MYWCALSRNSGKPTQMRTHTRAQEVHATIASSISDTHHLRLGRFRISNGKAADGLKRKTVNVSSDSTKFYYSSTNIDFYSIIRNSFLTWIENAPLSTIPLFIDL